MFTIKKFKMRLAVALIVILIYDVDCAKILGVFPTVGYSHYKLGFVLMESLAAKGHNVTFISPFPQKQPIKNLRDIELTGFVDEYERMMENSNLFDMRNIPAHIDAFMSGDYGLTFTDMTLSHPNVQKLLNSDETFDAVITEQFLNEALCGLAHHFNAPSILLSTIGSSLWTNELVGNAAPPSYIPDILLGYSPKMSFFQRLHSGIFSIFHRLVYYLHYYPKQDKILHKYIPSAPHLYDLIYNTSLILLNSDVSYSPPVPHMPNMIDIGGFHVKPSKKLTGDLKIFLDGAKEGAIYFNMGSYLKSKDLHKEKLDAILKVISKLKLKVLWKWEDDHLPNQPPNLKIAKWLPQGDVLGHPNIKAFITHGGLLSNIETIFHGIPIIGIPIFGDQKMNMANAVNYGYGILLSYDSLNEDTLAAALNEILTNPQYSQIAKTRSKIMRDQPNKPLARAVYWIEYIMRQKGAHFRSAGLDLTWYQYYFVDVALFVTTVIISVFAVFYIFIKKLLQKRKKVKVKLY